MLTHLFLTGCQHRGIELLKSHGDIDYGCINSDTLVIYDVDETLIQPTDTYLIHEHTSHGKAFLTKFVDSNPQFKNWDQLTSLLLKTANRPLIEKNIPEILKNIREKGAKIIALTAMNTGSLGDIYSLEKWRYSHLKQLGFVGDFASKIIHLKGFKRSPVFYKGMAAADLENKGPVLTALLKTLNYQPGSIIAIDDDIHALQSIQSACQDLNIPFKGYLYTGYKKPDKEKDWDEDMILFQANYLLNHKKWLSDQEAKSHPNFLSSNPKPGIVIVLNGPSASGKSTLQKAIQTKANEPYIALGVDNLFNDMFPDEHGSKVQIKADPKTLRSVEFTKDENGHAVVKLLIGGTGQKIAHGMNKAIAAYAKSGLNVVVDYIAYDPKWLPDLKHHLQDIPTYYVGIKIPLNVLEDREKSRGTSPVGHARSHYDHVHNGWNYDIEVNTNDMSSESAARKILSFIQSDKR